MAGTAAEGLMGALLGVLGGRIGYSSAGPTGFMVGSMFDSRRGRVGLGSWARSRPRARFDHSALLAMVDERSPEVVDAAMSKVGGTLCAGPMADMETEIAAAEDASAKPSGRAARS